MGVDAAIDITTEERQTVLALLQRHLPGTAAWVYGSRVKWTSRPQSDLDLVVFATPEQRPQVGDLREAFEESNLPFRVDLFVWDDVPKPFRKQIEAEHAVLVRGCSRVVMSSCQDAKRSRPSEPAASGSFGETDHETTRRFGDLFSDPPRNGLTRPKAVRGFGTKMVNMGELFAHARLDNVPMARVPLSQSEAGRFLLEKGDLLFARQSLVLEGAGKCSLFLGDDEPVTFESHVTRVRLDQRIASPSYFFYYLQSHHGRSAIRAIVVEQGAGASGIRGRDLVALDVLWRGLPEQRAIAHILGTLDDKIELNRRMNATLEAMARSLFRSWFVDFDPVRAKMEGRETGLPKDIADLFPDRLVASEIGWSPQGWPVTPMTSLMEVNPKRSLQRGEIAPYLDMANMPTEGHVPDSIVDRSFGSGMRFVNGDTLVARITPCLENGKTAYVDFLRDQEVGWGSTEYIVLKPQPPLPDQFAYCLARSTGFREFAVQNMSGTSGRQRVPASALSGFLMAAPPASLGAEFGNVAGFLFEGASRAVRESRALSALRDALLPKLVSGELRVKALETVCERQDRPASVGAHEA